MTIQWKCIVGFKGLDLRQSAWWTMGGGLWHCTEDMDQDHPHGKKRNETI